MSPTKPSKSPATLDGPANQADRSRAAEAEYVGPPDMQDDDGIRQLLANLVLLKRRGMDINMFFDKKAESGDGGMTVFELSTHFTHSLKVTVNVRLHPAPQENGTDPLTDHVRLYRASGRLLKSHLSPFDRTRRMKYNLAAPIPNPKPTALTPTDPGHVIGGAAAVHVSSSTFVTMYLPHFSAVLHIGDALVDNIAQMRRYQADALDRLARDTQTLSMHQSSPNSQFPNPNERTLHVQDLAKDIADAKDELAAAQRLMRVQRDAHHTVVYQVLMRNARFVVLPKISRASLVAGADPLPEDVTDADSDTDWDPDWITMEYPAPPLSDVCRNARDLGLARLLTQLPVALARAGVHAWTVSDAFAVRQCGDCWSPIADHGQVCGRVFTCCRCYLRLCRDENAALIMWINFQTMLRALGLHRGDEWVLVPLALVRQVVGVRERRLLAQR